MNEQKKQEFSLRFKDLDAAKAEIAALQKHFGGLFKDGEKAGFYGCIGRDPSTPSGGECVAFKICGWLIVGQ